MTLVPELLRSPIREFGRPLKRKYLEERWDGHVGQKTLSFPTFGLKVFIFTAKAAKTKKLRERNGLLGVVRMRRGVEKIALGVSRFVEHKRTAVQDGNY